MSDTHDFLKLCGRMKCFLAQVQPMALLETKQLTGDDKVLEDVVRMEEKLEKKEDREDMLLRLLQNGAELLRTPEAYRSPMLQSEWLLRVKAATSAK